MAGVKESTPLRLKMGSVRKPVRNGFPRTGGHQGWKIRYPLTV